MLMLHKKRIEEKCFDKYFCIPILIFFLVLVTTILITQVIVTKALTSSWLHWGEFSRCSVSCGLGVKVRWRVCPGLMCRGSSVNVRDCFERVCHSSDSSRLKTRDDWIDWIAWTDWSDWSDCNATCSKSGIRWRSRICQDFYETLDPLSCEGSNVELGECFLNCLIQPRAVSKANLSEVAINGNWGQWSNFSECTSPCGGGSQTRSRKCDNPSPASNGSICNGSYTDMTSCNVQDCYSWTSWSNSTSCSVSCGNGTQTRLRHCETFTNITLNSTANCSGLSIETISCFMKECLIAINGNWGQWSNFSECTSPCGGGRQTRSRKCDNPSPAFNGSICNGSHTYMTSCNVQDCYSWTSWSNSTSCSASCGNGTRTRSRHCEPLRNDTVKFSANCSGLSLETVPCFLKECPIDFINCSLDNGGCNQLCLSSNSDSFCSCYPGYTLDSDGRKCSDVDECLGYNTCDGFCINAPGGYFCLCYKSNYYWDRKTMKCLPNTKKLKLAIKIK